MMSRRPQHRECCLDVSSHDGLGREHRATHCDACDQVGFWRTVGVGVEVLWATGAQVGDPLQVSRVVNTQQGLIVRRLRAKTRQVGGPGRGMQPMPDRFHPVGPLGVSG